MSHKAAKKIRKLLNASMQAKDPKVHPCTEREYTENTKNRKKELVELKDGTTKEIEVSYGTMRVNSDTGRGIYKIVKRAMAGKKASNKRVVDAKPIPAVKPGNISPQGELKEL